MPASMVDYDSMINYAVVNDDVQALECALANGSTFDKLDDPDILIGGISRDLTDWLVENGYISEIIRSANFRQRVRAVRAPDSKLASTSVVYDTSTGRLVFT